jgi:hypothetical protein
MFIYQKNKDYGDAFAKYGVIDVLKINYNVPCPLPKME